LQPVQKMSEWSADIVRHEVQSGTIDRPSRATIAGDLFQIRGIPVAKLALIGVQSIERGSPLRRFAAANAFNLRSLRHKADDTREPDAVRCRSQIEAST
jgi:hypothetical protein